MSKFEQINADVKHLAEIINEVQGHATREITEQKREFQTTVQDLVRSLGNFQALSRSLF